MPTPIRRLLPPSHPSRRSPGAAPLLVAVVLLVSIAACGQSPQSPTTAPASVSGYVYQTGTAGFGEPSLATVLITVEQADGTQRSTTTDDEGFYSLSATAGLVSISATKIGFDTNRSRFDLVDHMVLNFSLTPTAP